MIKRYILEKVDFNGDIVVVGRYRSYYRAINRYTLLTQLRFRLGIKDSVRYCIKELPLLHTVYKQDIGTFVSTKVKSFDDFNVAICHCNSLNKNNDGSSFYYVDYSLVKED